MKHSHLYLVLSLCILVTSCADEDMALVGALATGAAAGYAQTNGDPANANALLNTQQQILNEASNTAAANAESAADSAPSTLVTNPATSNAHLQTTESSVASAGTAASSSSGSGITGTWKNSKLTWILAADGTGKLIVPSVNSNGVSTTYMTYRADPSAGTFTYTLTRSTLTGTINCTGDSDMEITTNKTYTQNYSLSGNSLTIGTEVMTRN